MNSTPEITRRLQSLLPVTTQTPDETRSLGAALAELLEPGAVVGLYGALGTGKTTLVKGIAQALGIPAPAVRSPTFTILHTYSEGQRPLHHFDAYRVQTPAEFVELGFEEYISFSGDDPDAGITCIEWADRVDPLLPASTVRLSLHHDASHQRRITLKGDADTSASE